MMAVDCLKLVWVGEEDFHLGKIDQMNPPPLPLD
jgi:hypothetical protein